MRDSHKDISASSSQGDIIPKTSLGTASISAWTFAQEYVIEEEVPSIDRSCRRQCQRRLKTPRTELAQVPGRHFSITAPVSAKVPQAGGGGGTWRNRCRGWSCRRSRHIVVRVSTSSCRESPAVDSVRLAARLVTASLEQSELDGTAERTMRVGDCSESMCSRTCLAMSMYRAVLAGCPAWGRVSRTSPAINCGQATHCQRAPFRTSIDDDNVFAAQSLRPDVYSASSQLATGHLRTCFVSPSVAFAETSPE